MQCEFVWYGCRTDDTPDERCKGEVVEKVTVNGEERSYCSRCAERIKGEIAVWNTKQREAVVINAEGEAVTFSQANDLQTGKKFDTVDYHQHCGYLDRHKTTRERESLHCHSCGLRFLVPAGLKTREQFLKYFKEFNP